MTKSRELAYKILLKIYNEKTYANLALKDEFARCDLSDKDKALVTEIVYGVLRYSYTLDYFIKQYSTVKQMDKNVEIILKMGIYQLKYLDKIPESAAVNESVELAKRYAKRAFNFVNAVLRGALRGNLALTLPTDQVKQLGVKYSYPEYLVQKIIKDYSEKAEEILNALNFHGETVIRVNNLLTNRDDLISTLQSDGIECEKTQISPDGVIVKQFGAIDQTKAYRDGLFTAQDEVSQLAVQVLNPLKGDVVIDVCAAPGGKATYCAEKMQNVGEVYAFDIFEHKLNLVSLNAKRLKINIVKTENVDATILIEELRGKADKVLVDAPCSALGMIGKKPDIKLKKDIDFKGLSKLQLQILNNAKDYLKSGGDLVYSTCTLSKIENEEVVKQFLAQNSDFELCDLSYLISCDKMLTIFPNEHLNGFFIAKFSHKGQ